jgi:hypothetical protein
VHALIQDHRASFLSRPIRFRDRTIGSLSLGISAPHLGSMKQAEIITGTEPGNSASENVALLQLDPVLTKFVEALAIADARRDHLASNASASKRIPDAASSSAGSSKNDTRSHLCTVFDRTSERKID